MTENEKREFLEQLEKYRKTQIAYLSNDDKNLDFSQLQPLIETK